MSAPTFAPGDRPSDILDGAGRWLAAELGWRWVKSRRDVESKRGTQTHQLSLQPSKWSRAGVATWVSARATVLDNALTAWRVAEPDLTSHPPSGLPETPFVYNSLLINIESDLSEFEASGLSRNGPRPKTLSLERFAEGLRSRVMPVLELFESPAALAQGSPQSWLRMMDADTIEWALACGDREAAAALLRMRLWRADMSQQSRAIMFEQFRVGWELAPDRDHWLPWAVESLGWLARVHHLISIDEVPHGRPT